MKKLTIAIAILAVASTHLFAYVPDDLDFDDLKEEPKASDARQEAPSGNKIEESTASDTRQAAPSENKIVVDSIGYEMVYIPPGTFTMGSPSNESGRFDDEGQHNVTITKGYYMGSTEVTQSQWEKIMGSNPSKFKSWLGTKRDCPVEHVSWKDCQKFVRKLNQIEGVNTYRLPTEAEWEYGCRAGTDTPFNTGRCLSTDQANYDGNYPLSWCLKGTYREKTLPVKSCAPNAWGLYDMHGNVWEWCSDGYGNYPSGSVTDPDGAPTGSPRVARGGGWSFSARLCRSANRDKYDPSGRLSFLGFRLSRTP